MKKIYNEIIDESVYCEKFENGLEIYFMPKKGYLEKYAVLGIDFGSNDLEFVPKGGNKKIKVNEGIAHFLEHKMFEQPEGENIFDEFAKYGANVNAFTSYNMTGYLFSCTDNFYESLNLMFNFIQKPYYTDENVQKEKGIIGQELKMYNDDVNSVLNLNCMKAMYSKINLRNDIGGSLESIERITKEELYMCYNTFYSPSNMKLFVIGDLDFDELINNLRKCISFKSEGFTIQRFWDEEPDSVNEKIVESYMSVSAPLVQIGYKDTFRCMDAKDKLKLELTTDILMDMIFSESDELSSDLYEKGLVVTTPYGGYTIQKNYAYGCVYYISKYPKKVKRIIDDYIDMKRHTKLDDKIFDITKKRKIGSFLKSFDSLAYIANNFLSYKMKGVDLLDYLQVLKSITIEDVSDRLNTFLLEENSVISIVYPKKVEGDSDE